MLEWKLKQSLWWGGVEAEIISPGTISTGPISPPGEFQKLVELSPACVGVHTAGGDCCTGNVPQGKILHEEYSAPIPKNQA